MHDPLVPTAIADRRAALALTLAPGVGPVRWRALLARAHGDASRALADAVPDHARRDALLGEADGALARAGARGLALTLLGDAAYPSGLPELSDPPPALWHAGDLGALDAGPRVAIVGTRTPSAYGLRAARALAGALARAGAVVVSGMARGIDAAAHEAALGVGARSVAVLGTGADVAYPAAHRRLHAELARSGAVLSERLPGAGAIPGAFPSRNRIIAALAPVTLVVEAGHRSGALITASVALDLGRTVGAVPGPIDAASAAGANALLRDGAQVVATIDDALALVGLAARAARAAGAGPSPAHASAPRPPTAPHARRTTEAAGPRSGGRPDASPRASAFVPLADAPPGLSADERAVWDALLEPAPDPDAVAFRSRLPARRCIAALTALELSGLIATTTGGALARR